MKDSLIDVSPVGKEERESLKLPLLDFSLFVVPCDVEFLSALGKIGRFCFDLAVFATRDHNDLGMISMRPFDTFSTSSNSS